MKSKIFGELNIGDEFKECPTDKGNLVKISNIMFGFNAKIPGSSVDMYQFKKDQTVWVDEVENESINN